LEQTVDKLEKAMNADDYSTKVPVEIQNSNVEKLEESKSEILRITSAMETLKLM